MGSVMTKEKILQETREKETVHVAQKMKFSITDIFS